MWLTLRWTIRKISFLFLFLRYRYNKLRFITSNSVHSKRSILINNKIIPFFNLHLIRFIVAIYFHHINWFIIVRYLWTTFNWLFTLNWRRFNLLFWLWLWFELKKWWAIIAIIFREIFEHIFFYLFFILFDWLLITLVLGNYTDLIIVIFMIFLYRLFWVNW